MVTTEAGHPVGRGDGLGVTFHVGCGVGLGVGHPVGLGLGLGVGRHVGYAIIYVSNEKKSTKITIQNTSLLQNTYV